MTLGLITLFFLKVINYALNKNNVSITIVTATVFIATLFLHDI